MDNVNEIVGKYVSEDNPFFPYTPRFEQLTLEDQTRILRLECQGGSAAFESRHLIQSLRVCSSCWSPIDEPYYCEFCFKRCQRCRYFYKTKDIVHVTNMLDERLGRLPIEITGDICKFCYEIKSIVYGEIPEIKEPEVE